MGSHRISFIIRQSWRNWILSWWWTGLNQLKQGRQTHFVEKSRWVDNTVQAKFWKLSVKVTPPWTWLLLSLQPSAVRRNLFMNYFQICLCSQLHNRFLHSSRLLSYFSQWQLLTVACLSLRRNKLVILPRCRGGRGAHILHSSRSKGTCVKTHVKE